jgi:hypothetical protein
MLIGYKSRYKNLLTTVKMTSREIVEVFEKYQKARIKFVQTVAELANRPRNIKDLQAHGVMDLLRPLLIDVVPSVQQSAAQALGRLANYNDELAEAVVTGEILPQLVHALTQQNVFSLLNLILIRNILKKVLLMY